MESKHHYFTLFTVNSRTLSSVPHLEVFKIHESNYVHVHFSPLSGQRILSKSLSLLSVCVCVCVCPNTLLCNFKINAPVQMALSIIDWCCLPFVDSINSSQCYIFILRLSRTSTSVRYKVWLYNPMIFIYANALYVSCIFNERYSLLMSFGR